MLRGSCEVDDPVAVSRFGTSRFRIGTNLKLRRLSVLRTHDSFSMFTTKVRPPVVLAGSCVVHDAACLPYESQNFAAQSIFDHGQELS